MNNFSQVIPTMLHLTTPSNLKIRSHLWNFATPFRTEYRALEAIFRESIKIFPGLCIAMPTEIDPMVEKIFKILSVTHVTAWNEVSMSMFHNYLYLYFKDAKWENFLDDTYSQTVCKFMSGFETKYKFNNGYIFMQSVGGAIVTHNHILTVASPFGGFIGGLEEMTAFFTRPLKDGIISYSVIDHISLAMSFVDRNRYKKTKWLQLEYTGGDEDGYPEVICFALAPIMLSATLDDAEGIIRESASFINWTSIGCSWTPTFRLFSTIVACGCKISLREPHSSLVTLYPNPLTHKNAVGKMAKYYSMAIELANSLKVSNGKILCTYDKFPLFRCAAQSTDIEKRIVIVRAGDKQPFKAYKLSTLLTTIGGTHRWLNTNPYLAASIIPMPQELRDFLLEVDYVTITPFTISFLRDLYNILSFEQKNSTDRLEISDVVVRLGYHEQLNVFNSYQFFSSSGSKAF
jgi:hypothetical protein